LDGIPGYFQLMCDFSEFCVFRPDAFELNLVLFQYFGDLFVFVAEESKFLLLHLFYFLLVALFYVCFLDLSVPDFFSLFG
jgi:hypothetical protein